MEHLDVNLPGQSYPIYFGALGEALPAFREKHRRAAVVSDENVWALYGEKLRALLGEAGLEFTAQIVKPGEGSKAMDELSRLLSSFARFGLRRNEPVIAFGGGVVGDLAGFAASVYMRGVPFVQIPTTLLSQVDSSVGGKVAVNLPEGKNLAGCFYQPEAVFCDTSLLATLPERELSAGIAEVYKYFAIGESALSPLLTGRAALLNNINRAVALCCACKAGYVKADERDTGPRMMLNFGHSFGHAIEKLNGFAKYNHGEAVAIGMLLAARTGEMLGLSVLGTTSRLRGGLKALGLSGACHDRVEDMIPLMAGDKKNSGGALSLVLLTRVGEPFLYRIMPDDLSMLWGREG